MPLYNEVPHEILYLVTPAMREASETTNAFLSQLSYQLHPYTYVQAQYILARNLRNMVNDILQTQ